MVGIPNGGICCKLRPQTILACNAKWCKCDLWAYGLPPPARILGSGQISTGAFLPQSSQPPILPETCSTPSLRPGIRPRQKRPGRILGLEYGVEQFSAESTACSTHAKMPGSSRNLPWLNSARPWSCFKDPHLVWFGAISNSHFPTNKSAARNSDTWLAQCLTKGTP